MRATTCYKCSSVGVEKVEILRVRPIRRPSTPPHEHTPAPGRPGNFVVARFQDGEGAVSGVNWDPMQSNQIETKRDRSRRVSDTGSYWSVLLGNLVA